ncbi:hypothetical protein [Dysgonomonas sp. Marseille-P4677]|nr:hypothetical protein [Dysgonomonas sp. Marseille-P4677]
MKLKIFNAVNSKAIPTGEITLRINKSAGLLAFSKATTDFF